MKIKTMLSWTFSTLLLTACIPSVEPFYHEKDVQFDRQLLGSWVATDDADQQVWEFLEDTKTPKAYKLTVMEKDNKRGQFSAHLFQLGQDDFLDLVPIDCDFREDQADLVGFCMFPGHLLVRLTRSESNLKLAFFDFDWLQKQLEANPDALAHRVQGDRAILTARTRDLQRFVRKHIRQEGLFGKPAEFKRRNDTPQPGS